MTFIDKWKYKVFPNITDWTDSHDTERYTKDWHKLKNSEWLLFRPIAYKSLLTGMVLGSTFLFGFLSWFFFNKGNEFMGVFSILLSLRFAWASFQKLRSWKNSGHTNFYDIIFRDYD